MLYTIYKTTNINNGKYYIGKHQTDNINDNYIGSGVKLKEAIRKYGREVFVKEILFVFSSEEEMNNKEKELVTEQLVKDKNTYNVGIGGEGGPHFLGKKHSQESKIKNSESNKGKFISDETRQKISKNNYMKGKSEQARKNALCRFKDGNVKLSEETKEKISKSLIGKKHNIVECPHCQKTGSDRIMKRWHFNNCNKVL